MSKKQNIISREDVISKIPQQDSDGNNIFRTYEFTLTGANHKHGGNYGDSSAIKAHSGDPVTLIFDKNNKYDDRAIRVEWNGKYIGWIPQSAATWKDPIITRLEKGCTVNAFITLVRPLKIREKVEDEKGHYVWDDAIVTTVDIVVVLYDLPNQRATNEKNKNKDFREPIPPEPELPQGCLGVGVVFIVICLILWWLMEKFFSFIGF